MGFEMSVDKQQLAKIKSNLAKTKTKVTSKRIMDTLLLQLKNDIFLRTNSGKDVNNVAFSAYNAFYAKSEGKTIVNLTKTGTMLNAMTQKVLSKTKGIIFFVNAGYAGSKETARSVARKHMLGEGVPKREFFGVSNQDTADAVKTYKKELDKVLNRVRI